MDRRTAKKEGPSDSSSRGAVQGKQEQTENRLEQTEQWLRMLIDSAEEYAIFSIDQEGKISSWSRGACKLFGYRAEEIVGREFAIIFTAEDRAEGVPEDEIQHAKREGYSPDIRWHVRKDGSRLFVSGSVRPLHDKDGRTLGFLKVAHDITEQRRTERQLRESEERYRLLVDSVKDFALFTLNVSGHITHWNPGAERLLGYSEEEILGQSVDCLYTMEDRKAGVPEREREIALREDVCINESWLVRKDGSRLFVVEALRRMENDQGKLKGFVKAAHDITQRKKLEDELCQAREHLEMLVEERTARLKQTVGELEAFSYSVSHDLRAPVRAMQGFSELVRTKFAKQLGPEGTALVDRIIDGAKRSDELIRDVLTLSHVARDPTHLEVVDVEQVLQHVLSGTPEFEQSRATIHIARPLHKVVGHSARLSQCFSNLLGNAVKFVPPGVRPHVKIWTEPFQKRIRIWVEDNGIGIPKGQEERIFGLFQRLHPEDVYHGTGVGLAIVRKSVERMNGKVGVESEPGKGSRFWIELPAATDPPS